MRPAGSEPALLVPPSPPYPPPPRVAPPDLGRRPIGPPIRRFVGLAATLTGISLFVAVPLLAAVGAFACLTAEDWPIIVRASGFIVLTTLAVVYLKSLLPRRISLPAAAVPVPAEELSAAYAFLARVAEDVGAPLPGQLVVGSGVELSLGGRRSLLDMARPATWDLHAGLWLWYALTLSEFQALLVRTMAPVARGPLERLRFTARALLRALADGSDRLDEVADDESVVGRMAAVVCGAYRWITLPCRVVAGLVLRVDTDEGDALSDDLAAVRVAGSDALVHSILRADFAGAAMRELDDALLQTARDGVFTGDYYAHFADAATMLREAHNDFTLGEVPSLRGPHAGKYADVFDPGRRYLSDVWRGMPLGDAREQSAKKHFVAAERDDRPAIQLLDQPIALRDRLTRLRYLEVLAVPAGFLTMPPETVRRWLATPASPGFSAKFAGCYDGGRRIDPGSAAERDAALASETWDDDRLLTTANSLYAHAADRAASWKKARAGLDRILVRTGYEPAGRLRAVADDLEEDLRKAGRWLSALDRWVYVTHVHMAARLPDLAVHDELIRRYESVLRFQPLAIDARSYRNRIAAFVRRLAAHSDPPPHSLGREALREFNASRNDLDAYLEEARAIDDPLLRVRTGDMRLDQFLYSHENPPGRGEQGIEDFGRRLLVAWDEVTAKARWLHRTAVAELLALQDRIHAEFADQYMKAHPDRRAADTVLDLEPEPIELDPIDPEPNGPTP